MLQRIEASINQLVPEATDVIVNAGGGRFGGGGGGGFGGPGGGNLNRGFMQIAADAEGRAHAVERTDRHASCGGSYRAFPA